MIIIIIIIIVIGVIIRHEDMDDPDSALEIYLRYYEYFVYVTCIIVIIL